MLVSMSAHELGEWQAYFMLEQQDRKRRDMDMKALQGVRQQRGRKALRRRRRPVGG